MHVDVEIARLERFHLIIAELRATCQLEQPSHGKPYNFMAYFIGGGKFAYFKTRHPERWRFSARVTPERFLELTDVAGVKPARYRGRFHQITIVDVSRFPEGHLRELVEWS